MTEEEINDVQSDCGLLQIQHSIASGLVWTGSGFGGRRAMELLKMGACYLPMEDREDYYGNVIPARYKLKEGAWGTIEYSASFWEEPGNIESFIEDNENKQGDEI